MDKVNDLHLIPIAIDSAVFYGANYLAHKVLEIASPEPHHVGVYVASDLVNRNSMCISSIPYINSFGKSGATTLTYIVGSSIYDIMIDGKGFRTGILNNAMRGLIAYGGNALIDYALSKQIR